MGGRDQQRKCSIKKYIQQATPSMKPWEELSGLVSHWIGAAGKQLCMDQTVVMATKMKMAMHVVTQIVLVRQIQ